MNAPSLNAVVTDRKDPTEETAIVRVAPDGWPLPSFQPGQYATLGLPDPETPDGPLLKRVYSVASAPGVGHLEFYIRLVKSGDFTTRLWHQHEGDRIFVDPTIRGTFTLDPVPVGRDIVLVATGTGMAPFVSMLRHFKGRERWRRLVIVHGARLADELGYREELESAATGDDSITYIPLVTREPEDSAWPGERGRVTRLVDDGLYEQVVGAPLEPESCHVFLCGNPAMIDGMEGILAPHGFRRHSKKQAGNLHFERYW